MKRYLLQNERRWCFLLDEHAYIVYSSLNTTISSSSGFSGDEARMPKNFNLLGRWFGSVNRITERTMTLLLKNNYYTEFAQKIFINFHCIQHKIFCHWEKYLSLISDQNFQLQIIKIKLFKITFLAEQFMLIIKQFVNRMR